MDNLNPLFNEIGNRPSNRTKKTVYVAQQRKERSDKQKNIKFPVDHLFHLKLRTLCRQAAPAYQRKYRKPLSQTKFNTLLLRYVLNHVDMVSWELEYSDSKRYLHTNILKSEYKEIGGPYGLSIRIGFSDRKTVYMMMRAGLKWIERGGEIEEIL